MVPFSCSYNKEREDFQELREYNDYLEIIEDIGESRCGTSIMLHSHVRSISRTRPTLGALLSLVGKVMVPDQFFLTSFCLM